MSQSIFGFRTYQSPLQSGVARHAAGLARPENALTRTGWPAAKNLLVDEPPGTGWPARLDFVDSGWSTGADIGAADASSDEPGVPRVVVQRDDGTTEDRTQKRARKSRAISRVERQLLAADHGMRAEIAKPRRGKRPCQAVELLFAGPPPWDSPDAWSLKDVIAWARDTVEFVHKFLPDAVIAAASLHLDEHSPHVHVMIAPIVYVRDSNGTLTGKTKLGSRAVRVALAESAPERTERLKLSYRDELSRAAAAYAHHVGAAYGLAAGRVASTAKHVPVDPVEGARRRAETNDQRAAEAEARAEQAGASAAQYEEARDKAADEFTKFTTEIVTLRRERVELRGSREVDAREAAQASAQRETEKIALDKISRAHRREADYAGGVLGLAGLASQKGRALLDTAVEKRTAAESEARTNAEHERDDALRDLTTRTKERDKAQRDLSLRTKEHDEARHDLSLRTKEHDEVRRDLRRSENREQVAYEEGFEAGEISGVKLAARRIFELVQFIGERLPARLVAPLQRWIDTGQFDEAVDPTQVSARARQDPQTASKAPARRKRGESRGYG